MLKLWQHKKGGMFVCLLRIRTFLGYKFVMLAKILSFSQLPAGKKTHHWQAWQTNIWPFLFSWGFIRLLTYPIILNTCMHKWKCVNRKVVMIASVHFGNFVTARAAKSVKSSQYVFTNSYGVLMDSLGYSKSKSYNLDLILNQILCGPNSNPNPK